MKKFLTDMHTHSFPASHDGGNSLAEMLNEAQKKGVAFYGISEHFDYDYDVSKMDEEEYKSTRNGDVEESFHRARHLQEDYEGVMNVAVGAEFGYSEKEEVQGMYASTYEKYRPDFVINSVHGGEGLDFARYVFTESKEEIYRMYLRLIRKSLDVPYYYDIVGHIGYIARYVPFEDRSFSLEEFGEEIDDILKTIIAKDKILELNSSTKNLPQLCLPDLSIVQRYYDLGGRKVSYGSDAHFTSRILDKREEICAALKKIGFTYITVPFKGEHIKVEI
ncbi:MAG: histidinol-phosphatase HisJ family protein [Clostridia bacterium]|nr:histidinol-phosphatase HisJ family protein [Clostridia bacterium]